MNKNNICGAEGCNKERKNGGYCWAHYYRNRRNGSVYKLKRSTPVMSRGETCQVDGCNGKHKAKGYCVAHYTRLIRHGSVDVVKTTAAGVPMKWIRDNLNHKGEDCLYWPFSRGSKGDALVSINGSLRSAPRVMLGLLVGFPENHLNLDASHNCGKGHLACMNPSHLRWDTRQGNFKDKIEHGTHTWGESHPVAKLTETQVRFIIASNESISSLASMFNVSKSNISAIRNRKRWKRLEL